MIDSLLKRYSLIERPCDIGGSDWFVARDVFFEWWAEEPRSESSKSQGRLEIITWKQVLQFGSTPPTQDHPVASLEFFRSRFRILKPSLHPGDDDDIILGGGADDRTITIQYEEVTKLETFDPWRFLIGQPVGSLLSGTPSTTKVGTHTETHGIESQKIIDSKCRLVWEYLSSQEGNAKKTQKKT